jgi:hypothetical protein
MAGEKRQFSFIPVPKRNHSVIGFESKKLQIDFRNYTRSKMKPGFQIATGA